VHGGDGKWKDPFSNPAYTQRQRTYNQQICRTGNIYTPQMVIDGKLEAVGSRRLPVLSAIREAEKGLKERLDVGVTLASGKVEKVTLTGPVKATGSVWLVRFIK
jgi:hypothetical protein